MLVTFNKEKGTLILQAVNEEESFSLGAAFMDGYSKGFDIISNSHEMDAKLPSITLKIK